MIVLLLQSLLLGAQPQHRGGHPMEVTGVVVDANELPVVGASVVESGTHNGAISDLDGKFTLRVRNGATLEISCIGYVTVKQEAAPTMHIVLAEDNELLEETVVIGYGVQKKSSLTGAISQVKAEDLQNRTAATLQEALQGKTAGVQFVSVGSAPGETGGSLRIRGISSNASTDPLFVVDGVRMTDINNLDPNDIESTEVLKDAASAAIYGAEAGNGVILITTKKGKKGEGKIAYDFQHTIQSLGRRPEVMSTAEFVEFMGELGVDAHWDGVTSTNWVDALFENSNMQKHSLSFRGGNDKGNLYVSVGYLDNDGIIKGKNDIYKRLTSSINADYNIKKWLKVGLTANLSRSSRKNQTTNAAGRNLISEALMYDPTVKLTYAPGELPSNMQTLVDNDYPLMTDENGNYYGITSLEGNHPIVLALYKQSLNTSYDVNGSFFANVTPLKGLVLTSRFGYKLSSNSSRTITPPYYYSASNWKMFLEFASKETSSIYYQWENFANYSKTWNQAHTLTAMAGFSFSKRTNDFVSGSLSANGEDALQGRAENYWHLKYASDTATKTIDGETTEIAKMSWFGRIGYEYKNKYMVQASLRADAADLSFLPKSGRWGYFPSVSAGWTISEEPFFAPLKGTVNNLKFRASWGQNGSLASLGSYEYASTIVTSQSYPLVAGGATVLGHEPNALGNELLRWETSEQFDLGLDGRLFNDRLSFGIDYFDKATKGLLITGVTPSLSVGGTLSPINAGNVSNKGFEFELGWKDTIGDFRYGINGNLATLKNMVTYLDPSLDLIPGVTQGQNTYYTAFEEGYPIYHLRGYKFAGVNPENGDPLFYTRSGEKTSNPGGSDADFDLGSGIPKLTAGITLTAAYKGLDLVVFGNGAFGNQVFLLMNEIQASNNKIRSIYYADRWTPTNTNASRPRALVGTLASTYNKSSAYVFSGDFFKIQQIQLGYTLPKKLLKKIAFSNARVYCSLEDFFLFTDYPGYSPEAASDSVIGAGIDFGAYPTSKKVVFGLNVEF